MGFSWRLTLPGDSQGLAWRPEGTLQPDHDRRRRTQKTRSSAYIPRTASPRVREPGCRRRASAVHACRPDCRLRDCRSARLPPRLPRHGSIVRASGCAGCRVADLWSALLVARLPQPGSVGAHTCRGGRGVAAGHRAHLAVGWRRPRSPCRMRGGTVWRPGTPPGYARNGPCPVSATGSSRSGSVGPSREAAPCTRDPVMARDGRWPMSMDVRDVTTREVALVYGRPRCPDS